MNWEAAGAIGELTGAILLLGSLVFVGLQIREARKQLTLNATLSRMDDVFRVSGIRIASSEVSIPAAELKSVREEELTLEERDQLLNYLFLSMWSHYKAFYLLRNGSIDPKDEQMIETSPTLFSAPIYLELWKEYRSLSNSVYSEDFVEHIDGLLKQQEEHIAKWNRSGT